MDLLTANIVKLETIFNIQRTQTHRDIGKTRRTEEFADTRVKSIAEIHTVNIFQTGSAPMEFTMTQTGKNLTLNEINDCYETSDGERFDLYEKAVGNEMW